MSKQTKNVLQIFRLFLWSPRSGGKIHQRPIWWLLFDGYLSHLPAHIFSGPKKVDSQSQTLAQIRLGRQSRFDPRQHPPHP
jgi:hypothetical protein